MSRWGSLEVKYCNLLILKIVLFIITLIFHLTCSSPTKKDGWFHRSTCQKTLLHLNGQVGNAFAVHRRTGTWVQSLRHSSSHENRWYIDGFSEQNWWKFHIICYHIFSSACWKVWVHFELLSTSQSVDLPGAFACKERKVGWRIWPPPRVAIVDTQQLLMAFLGWG